MKKSFKLGKECDEDTEIQMVKKCDAARNLKMHYSQLHSLLSSEKKPHGQALSQCAKKNVIKCYLGNKISQQLPYKRFKKLHFLYTSLAVAYKMYTKEQMKLGFRVLSQSSVYRCLKGRFCV